MIIARGFAALFTAAIVAAAMPALAQEGGRLRGEMTKLSGDTLTVKTDDGKTADVTLDSGYTVSHAVAI
jgi:hypothetical protein